MLRRLPEAQQLSLKVAAPDAAERQARFPPFGALPTPGSLGATNLTVSLGNALDLVLLLDRVRVRAPLGSVDELVSLGRAGRRQCWWFAPIELRQSCPIINVTERKSSKAHQALSNGLHVAEGSLAGAGGQEEDGLVHAAERGDIHSLRGSECNVRKIPRHLRALTDASERTKHTWRRTTPAEPMRVASSRGPALMMASTRTCATHRPSAPISTSAVRPPTQSHLHESNFHRARRDCSRPA